jgi:hypothetical protein
MTHAPTSEQHAAIDGFRTGGNMVVEAAAGTGKTSTLRFIADVDPTKRGLYLAFNKGIATEAASKFAGTNVEARTAHSLAYAQFGRPMSEKLAKGQRMRSGDRAEALGLKGPLMMSGNGMGTKVAKNIITRVVGDTVTQFCRSADVEIGAQHVPVPVGLLLNELQTVDFQEQVLVFAKRYWNDVLDPNGVLPYTHDFYLKQWAMSAPVLGYDYILFDEAQDADPTIGQVVKNQTHAQIVAVGDRSQAIYEWRGATDAMDMFGGDTFQLTQSFRFGHAIADEANEWLELLDANLRVRGSDKPSSVHESKNRAPEAVLCRTNAGAIGEVMDSQRAGIATGIAGKGRATQMRNLAEAAHSIQTKHFTYHPDLDVFKNWSDVQAFVEEEEGSELAPLVKLVDKYGAERLMSAIDKCVPDTEARTVVATAHVAKGLEWTHVKISDDFVVPGKDDNGDIEEMAPGEARLAYVAVTRAIRHLDPAGLNWIRGYKNALRRPELGLEWRRRFFDERKEAREANAA